jgi:asparagine synthase (glutamine-hydrolysing)
VVLHAPSPMQPALNVRFGFRRLAILDLAARADQPFQRGDRTLVYNGELYNYRALAEGLKREGEVLTTSGDTEVLAALLARRGLEGLGGANGMWAFVALDQARRTLTAARDRTGKKPLFWAEAPDGRLLFASEIAPLLTLLGRKGRLTREALDGYLATGWVFPRGDGSTHIEGIREVLPGTALTVDLDQGTHSSRTLYDLRATVTSARASPPPAESLPGIMRDAVLARLVSDRPVGLLLSGGIDSSLILSVLAAEGRLEQVHTFSGDAGRSEDAAYARQSVAALGVTAHMIPLDYGKASLDGFLATCRHQEKPFPFIGNVLSAPQLYAAIQAAGVPVVLDGAGGDEIFAGYWERTWVFAVAEAAARGDAAWLASARAENADRPELLARLDRTVAEVAHGRFNPAEAWRVSPATLSADLTRFARPDFAAPPAADPLSGCGPDLTEALIRDAAPGGRLGEWLWQNDRNAMAASLENRSPLLDYRLMPWMATGYAAKFQGPWNKQELRALFPHFAPLEVAKRREKQGFRWHYTPFMRAHRTALMDLVRASKLLATRLDVEAVLAAVDDDEDRLFGELLQRMICIAALESVMGLAE